MRAPGTCRWVHTNAHVHSEQLTAAAQQRCGGALQGPSYHSYACCAYGCACACACGCREAEAQVANGQMKGVMLDSLQRGFEALDLDEGAGWALLQVGAWAG